MDVLQGAGAELSLAELGLGSYTPVGLIQNLLEFMHVSIGLPWWGAIVVGEGFFFYEPKMNAFMQLFWLNKY